MGGNSSATGGYLQQLGTSLTDDQIIDAVNGAIAGITGFAGNMIRPRWQLNPPRMPDNGTDWIASGITTRVATDYPVIQHKNGGPDRLTRWSTYTVTISVYGPNAGGNAEILRDGLYISQNLEALSANNIKLRDVGDTTAVPELVNNQWYNRSDIEIRLAISISRDYNVLDIASAEGTITADSGVTATFDVEP